jgi:hypothetical protein
VVREFDGYTLEISPWVLEKIATEHGVTETDVEEAYCNSSPADWRRPRNPRHDPPETWRIIAPTMSDRVLVLFLTPDRNRRKLKLKTALWLDEL